MGPRILQRDTSCPNGGVFYSCNAGFVGCCLVEACNPGIGCPQDKDTTSDERTNTETSTTKSITAATSSQTAASVPSTPATSAAPSPTSTTVAISTSSVLRPADQSSPIESSTAHPKSGHIAPTAVIVGGVVGGLILLALIVGLYVCARRKQRTKVFKAAVYPSPHVGSDMSPQLPDYHESSLPRSAGLVGLGTKQTSAPHIDGEEVMPAAEMGETQARHMVYAELAASNDNIRIV